MEFPIVALLLGIMNECGASRSISKRVINGLELITRPSSYSTLRYFGAFVYGTNPIWNYIAYWDLIKPTAVWCSGAFLTPGIFQTACHCLADFDANDVRPLSPPLIWHNWEGRMIIYPGVNNRFGNDSFETSGYVKTTYFVVHQKCAKFGGREVFSYDYGLVRLDDSWIKDTGTTYPWTEIDFAPMYTSDVIKKFHDVAQQKQLVCMALGFGQYKEDEPITSDVLRIGWVVLMSRSECFEETHYLLDRFDLPYNQRFNWVCSQSFFRSRSDRWVQTEFGPGDSGGPFSCDNTHMAVISGGETSTDIDGNDARTISKHHAHVHTLYSNAIDYRNSFIRTIVDDTPTPFVNRSLSIGDGFLNGFSESKRSTGKSDDR